MEATSSCGGRAVLVGDKDDLSKLSAAELEKAYAACIQAAKATEHVGRHNRLIGRNKSRVGKGAKRRARVFASMPQTAWASLRSAHPTVAGLLYGLRDHDAECRKRNSRTHQTKWPGRTPAIAAARISRRFAAYFSDNTSPLKSALTIRPVCSPESVSTAPFWLARTMPCAPLMMAAPAPPWP
jgi:hypothetical protein